MGNILQERLAEKPYLVADGAMGTNLFALGLQTGDSPELWNDEHQDRVTTVHRRFLEAGSDIILTNSFGGTRHRLKLHNLQSRCHELNKKSAEIAKKEVLRFEKETGRKALVAGSMGPTGELFQPLGTLTEEEALDAFTEQAKGLAEGGADILWVETMSSHEEIAAGVNAAATTGLPIVCTMTFDTNTRSMMGVTPEAHTKHCLSFDPLPTAFGANCGVGPSELLHSLIGIKGAADVEVVLVAKGNCGIPHYHDGEIHYDGSPETMASYAKLARDAGARIIGGCCGSTHEHVQAIAEALDGYNPQEQLTLDRITEEMGAPWGGQEDAGGAEQSGGRRRRKRR